MALDTIKIKMALDTHKAFDSVERPYLQEVLAKFGFGEAFLCLAKLLYYNPRASIRVNNCVSESFTISRVTRQGYPLSLLWFALAIEPLEAVASLGGGFRAIAQSLLPAAAGPD